MANNGSKVMAKKNKAGMSLHKWVSTGGDPKKYASANANKKK